VCYLRAQTKRKEAPDETKIRHSTVYLGYIHCV